MALRALEVGAVEVIAKPAIDVTKSLNKIGEYIIDAVKAASKAKVKAISAPIVSAANAKSVAKVKVEAMGKTTHQILAIASSTGGTEALKVLLQKLPPNIPGTLIVQHIPPVFSKTFADSLNKMCPFEVKEAADGDRVHPGLVLIAPGNYHMELTRSGAYYYVKLNQEPPVHAVRPAADILMKSVAKIAGANAIGVVLTGMGKDGALGLLEMKKAGSYNISQDEASCVVYGMPREAVELGAIHKVLPLEQIAKELVDQFSKRDVA
jgi:two-component system chemotaxis response regulator CheB